MKDVHTRIHPHIAYMHICVQGHSMSRRKPDGACLCQDAFSRAHTPAFLHCCRQRRPPTRNRRRRARAARNAPPAMQTRTHTQHTDTRTPPYDVLVHGHMHVRCTAHMHTHAHMHTCTHAHTHAHTHTCACTCTPTHQHAYVWMGTLCVLSTREHLSGVRLCLCVFRNTCIELKDARVAK